MRYLLDTDHLTLLERKQGPDFLQVMQTLEQVDWNEIGVSVVSFHEQSLGCNSFISRAKSSADIVRGYSMFGQVIEMFSKGIVVPFDAAAAASFEQLRSTRIRVATMDLRLAATALSRSLILVTRNSVDFGQVPGLQIEDWTVRKPR